MPVTTWHNPDGLIVRYGGQRPPTNIISGLNTLGSVKTIEIDVDLVRLGANGTSFSVDLNNDGINDGFTSGDVHMPAYSTVVGASYTTIVPSAGGTSFTVGIATQTGTITSGDALITAANAPLASHDAIGERVKGTGTYVDSALSVGPNDAFPVITAQGTFTAGRGRLLIQYVDPVVDA